MIARLALAFLFDCLRTSARRGIDASRVIKDGSIDAVLGSAASASRIISNTSSRTTVDEKPAFFFVQLADPQLGMLNLGKEDMEEAKDFQDELRNLRDAVEKIKLLRDATGNKPRIVVMSGDMQNFWSADFAKNLALGPDSHLGDYGAVQAKAVKETMDVLPKHGIPVEFTPGNHDLDDSVSITDINRYKDIWGPDHSSFWIDNVFFMSVNSQLYFEDEAELPPAGTNTSLIPNLLAGASWLHKLVGYPDLASYRDDQTSFLEAEFLRAQNQRPAAIVALTHIPPFIGRDEKHGWANWHMKFRNQLLEKISPDLWLCGHFHGNVRSQVRIGAKTVEVVTTGAVGTSMLWNNTLENEYTPKHASTIALAPTGNAAFGKHIVDGSKENIAARISTSKDISGLRIVQFYANGKFRHKWFTLNQFDRLWIIDEEI